jgi:hypothetical protein
VRALSVGFGALAACSPVAADPAPPVTITNVSVGKFSIEATKSPVKLQVVADIQGLRDGKWQSMPVDAGRGYRLLSGCGDIKDTCITVATKIEPVPWTGMSCSSQCNKTCDKNAPLAAGDYRLVVKTCDDGKPIAGPSFHFDGKPRE